MPMGAFVKGVYVPIADYSDSIIADSDDCRNNENTWFTPTQDGASIFGSAAAVSVAIVFDVDYASPSLDFSEVSILAWNEFTSHAIPLGGIVPTSPWGDIKLYATFKAVEGPVFNIVATGYWLR